MVRPRGKIVVKAAGAGEQDRKPIDFSPLVINEIQVIGSRCGPFPDAVFGLASDKVDVLSLISRRVNLADGVEAMRVAQQPGVIKVLLQP